MDRHRAVWNERYERLLREGRTVGAEPWLEAWLHLVPDREPRRALDLGCGAGHNSRLLTDHGLAVTAIDISEQALEVCAREAPEAKRQRVDVRKGLPFPDDSFELIVADLCLHYFDLETTGAAVGDIGSCLVPGGMFAGRFNSTADVNYGADSKPVLGDDPHLRAVGGIEKRFFSEVCVDGLFAGGWEVHHRTEKTTYRFGEPKVVWEVVAVHLPS